MSDENQQLLNNIAKLAYTHNQKACSNKAGLQLVQCPEGSSLLPTQFEIVGSEARDTPSFRGARRCHANYRGLQSSLGKAGLCAGTSGQHVHAAVPDTAPAPQTRILPRAPESPTARRQKSKDDILLNQRPVHPRSPSKIFVANCRFTCQRTSRREHCQQQAPCRQPARQYAVLTRALDMLPGKNAWCQAGRPSATAMTHYGTEQPHMCHNTRPQKRSHAILRADIV